MLKNNHIDANKRKIKGILYLEDIFRFCKSFENLTKNLGCHLLLKTNDLQDFIYTSMAEYINVTIDNLYLYIPNLLPSVETQLLFNEATQNNHMISYDKCFTERRVKSNMIIQTDIGSTQQVSSPQYLTCAHQTRNRIGFPYKNNNFAIFDNLELRKYYVEMDGPRYPRDSLLINYEENDYIE